jgi:hypothetical protein
MEAIEDFYAGVRTEQSALVSVALAKRANAARFRR